MEKQHGSKTEKSNSDLAGMVPDLAVIGTKMSLEFRNLTEEQQKRLRGIIKDMKRVIQDEIKRQEREKKEREDREDGAAVEERPAG
jgi:predicted KAP-like P-loop ATPase